MRVDDLIAKLKTLPAYYPVHVRTQFDSVEIVDADVPNGFVCIELVPAIELDEGSPQPDAE